MGDATAKLNELRLDELHFEGPGTSLTIGLFPSSQWLSGRFTTVDGIVHAPNIPTEEVFVDPRPVPRPMAWFARPSRCSPRA